MTGTVPATNGTGSPAGRTRITVRALTRLIAGLTAEAIGVPRRGVHVTARDEGGLLSFDISAPIPLPALERACRKGDAVAASAPHPASATVPDGASGSTSVPGRPSVPDSILERASHARRTVRDRAELLTGSRIASVNLRFTSTSSIGRRVQ